MTRVWALRAGYACLALSLFALGAARFAGALLPAALAFAFAGGIVLLFSQDEYPRWAGVALVAYLALVVIAFLASTPVTIRAGGRYFIEPPNPEFAANAFYYLGFASPVAIAGATLVAAWEREMSARWLCMGGLGALALWLVLTALLQPDPSAVERASTQGELLQWLFSLSVASAGAGAAWSAARPEDYA